VHSLCGVDMTGWAASLLPFPGGLACHGRSNQLVGGNVMSLLTRGEPPSVVVTHDYNKILIHAEFVAGCM